MGTRADFYIGRGQDAKWLGSVAWDGYVWSEDKSCAIMAATTEQEFEDAVAQLRERNDFTTPEQGWPWPWSDSRTTDYAYVLHDNKVKAYCFGTDCDDEKEEAPIVDWFPNMDSRKSVTFGERSGIITFSA